MAHLPACPSRHGSGDSFKTIALNFQLFLFRETQFPPRLYAEELHWFFRILSSSRSGYGTGLHEVFVVMRTMSLRQFSFAPAVAPVRVESLPNRLF